MNSKQNLSASKYNDQGPFKPWLNSFPAGPMTNDHGGMTVWDNNSVDSRDGEIVLAERASGVCLDSTPTEN